MKSLWPWLSLIAFLTLIIINVGHGDTRKDSTPAEKSDSEPRSQPGPAPAASASDSKQPAGGVSGEAGSDKKAPEEASSGSAKTSPKAKDGKRKKEEDDVIVEDVKTAETDEKQIREEMFGNAGEKQSKMGGGDSFDLNSDERLTIYQKVFMEKRQRHLSAVEDMMTSYDYEQQFKLVNMVFEKMQEMYSQSRKTLTEHGFEPGMPFPGGDAKGELLEALSVLLENVAFLGDIVLRLPDISSSVYNKNRQFRDLAKWAIKFVGDTKFFDDVHKKLLHLLSQELRIVKRDPDFVNPFRREAEPVEFDTTGTHIKKKKPKPKKRGPRMSKQEL